MRGTDAMQESLFTVSKLEDFVPMDHPLRAVRLLVNEALVRLNGFLTPSTRIQDETPSPRETHARPAAASVLPGAPGATIPTRAGQTGCALYRKSSNTAAT